MSSISSLGFERTRLDVTLDLLRAEYKQIYGADIQVDPDDIDGQLLGLLANWISDLHQLGEDAYNSLNPNTASGVALSRLVEFNGIRRSAGLYSTATIDVSGTPGVLIPTNSLVRSTIDNTTWATTTDIYIKDTGVESIPVRCTVMGPVYAPPGTLTTIATPLYGWYSATNPSYAVLGRLEETDEQLRMRRKLSTSTPAQCIRDAIYGTLSNLEGVRVAQVYENNTHVVDANGQPPHSIYSIVEGGDEDKIAEVIYVKYTGGATAIGSIEKLVNDTNGSPHRVRFSRPTKVPIYIIVNITRLTGYSPSGSDDIKKALSDYGLTLNIGEQLLNGRLYTPVNTVYKHNVTSILVGTTVNPTAEANVTVAYDALIDIDPSRITVNVT